jgi:hypothetical protein
MSGDERKDQSRIAGSVYELRGDEFIIGALSPRVAKKATRPRMRQAWKTVPRSHNA